MPDDPFVFRSPDGQVLLGFGDITKAEKIDVDFAAKDPIAEMRRTDRLPDPARLTVGDVAEALEFLEAWGHPTSMPAIYEAVFRRKKMLGASAGYATLRDWLQANEGVNLSADTIQIVISRLATKLRKPFDAVKPIPLTDAVKILDDETTGDGRQGDGKASEGKGKTDDPATPKRKQGQPLTADESREYRRIIRELKKEPHAARGKNGKVADRLGIDIKIVVKAAKWGRKHGKL